jgi:saccharopine dehydrogenase-like NADP-dependent oxidoreductase
MKEDSWLFYQPAIIFFALLCFLFKKLTCTTFNYLGMKKQILLFGAGKSSACLIDYLLKEAALNEWQLIIADSNLEAAVAKAGNSKYAKAVSVNVEDSVQRNELIKAASIVISLLPPALHFLVAQGCIEFEKNLLTASYADTNIRSLETAINEKRLFFLCEMGLDPGIDHMSAMQLIHHIKDQNGVVNSFRSHCGGLVAPESDDNPWHYKISWNPRNVVMAGKTGAVYKENDQIEKMKYENLFDSGRVVDIPEIGYLSWYPNRDSLSYISLYELGSVHTFIRTTLRYPEFCFGWKHIVDLKLTDESIQYDTDGMTLQQFFKLHFDNHGFSDWLEKQLIGKFDKTKQLLEKLMLLIETEKEANPGDKKAMQEFMMVDEAGRLEDINLEEVKNTAAATVAGQMHEANLSMKQLFYLGMDDGDTVINKGKCSAADVLQFALEKKLVLRPQDQDMIVMLHEIEYTVAEKDFAVSSHLIVKGEDNLRTAMAKTVGLPLGIVAKLILQGKLALTGLHIPVIPEIYEPVLKELEKHDVKFNETFRQL